MSPRQSLALASAAVSRLTSSSIPAIVCHSATTSPLDKSKQIFGGSRKERRHVFLAVARKACKLRRNAKANLDAALERGIDMIGADGDGKPLASPCAIKRAQAALALS
jgi:hypothetical protein